MTAPARITQDDIRRAAKGIAAAGIDRARIVLDLQAQRIEIILGEAEAAPAPLEEWDDEDT